MKCSGCGADVARGISTCRRCGTTVVQSVAVLGAAPAPGLEVAPAAVLDEVGQPPERYNLKPLTITVTVLLSLHVVLLVLSLLGSPLAKGIETVLMLATAAAVITWLYQARSNTNGIGYRHQLPRFWAIAGWFVPVAFLYLPVRMVLDVWWARLPQGQRRSATARVLVWWTCWCLAWFTSFTATEVATRSANGNVGYSMNYTLYLGTTVASCVFLVLAAVALIVVVRGISAADPNRR